jgi:RHS repeat-associated protein
VATNYLYNGANIHATYSSLWDAPGAKYVHGGGIDVPIIRIASSGKQYFHQDGLGSVVALTSATGTVDGSTRFDAWGNATATMGAIPIYGYAGREPDETGFNYYRARHYDPALGRFSQRDPIGMTGGLNPYLYALANPVNLTDPLGLTPREAAAGLIADASQSYSSVGDASSAAYSGLNLGTRALGALQAAGGLVEAGLTLPLCPTTGLACLGVAHGLDVGAAGLRQIFSGQPESSVTAQALGRVLDPVLGSGTGRAFDAGMSAGFTLGGSLATSAPAVVAETGLLPQAVKGGPTSGLLYTPSGTTSLVSGIGGPAQAVAGGPGSGFNIVTTTHVEGHAAALMGLQGATSAVLQINRVPCASCEALLPKMLPPGARLTIVGPDGYMRTFTGVR